MSSVSNVQPTELERFASTCSAINEQVDELNKQVDGLVASVIDDERFQRRKEDRDSSESIVSLLAVKNRATVQYLANLAYLHLRKLAGLTIRHDVDENDSANEGTEVVKRLVELRATLERARPLHERMTYQLTKLLRRGGDERANGEDLAERQHDDQKSAKPRLDEILEDEQDDDEDNSDSDADSEMDSEGDSPAAAAGGKYVPPRIAPAYFDESTTERQKRRVDTLRKRALTSSLIDELSSEYQVGPDEFHEGDGRRQRLRREKDREVYEENNFRRITLSKHERQAARRAMTGGSLNDLVNFGDARALFTDGDGDADAAPKRRKSGPSDGKRRGRLGKKARKAKKGKKR